MFGRSKKVEISPAQSQVPSRAPSAAGEVSGHQLQYYQQQYLQQQQQQLPPMSHQSHSMDHSTSVPAFRTVPQMSAQENVMLYVTATGHTAVPIVGHQVGHTVAPVAGPTLVGPGGSNNWAAIAPQQPAQRSESKGKSEKKEKKHHHHHRSRSKDNAGSTSTAPSHHHRHHHKEHKDVMSTAVPLDAIMALTDPKPSVRAPGQYPVGSAAPGPPVRSKDDSALGLISGYQVVTPEQELQQWDRLAKESAVFAIICGLPCLSIPAAYYAFRKSRRHRHHLSFLLSVIAIVVFAIIMVSVVIYAAKDRGAEMVAA